VALSKYVNLKGDLFATAASFGTQAIIKLGSSLILTRLLRPEAYGIITILMSVTFVIELIGDINVTLFIIRDKNAEEYCVDSAIGALFIECPDSILVCAADFEVCISLTRSYKSAAIHFNLVCGGCTPIDVISTCNPT